MIYLASPYSDPDSNVRESRYLQACEACANLASRRYVIYSPIVHWHMVAKLHKLPTDSVYWGFQDAGMITICREFWVLTLTGWEDSVGVASDLEYADSVKKRVQYIRLEDCSRI